MELYNGQLANIPVAFPSNPLAPYGLDYPDITEVYMGLKIDTKKDADDKYLAKYQTTSGVVVDAPNHTFTIKITPDDYTSITPARSYKLVLGVKVAAYSKMIELEISDPEIKIVEDKIRQ